MHCYDHAIKYDGNFQMPSGFRLAAALIAACFAVPCAAEVTTKPVAEFGSCAKPEYPREALRYDQQGKVTLAFLIGANGQVKQSKVLKSSGFPLLDLAAQQGIEKCTFRPGSKDGQPADAWTQMQYVWTLEGKGGDPAARLNALRTAAQRGAADGQYQLGTYYWNANNPHRNMALGDAWLRKAAEQGHLDAQHALGLMRTGEYGGTQDYEEAAAWFRQAAESGHAEAQYMLATLHMRGDGVPKNETEATQWLLKAAAKGSVRAQTELAAVLTQSDQRAAGKPSRPDN